VLFPAAEEVEGEGGDLPPGEHRAGIGRGTVLVVDDEATVRSVASRMLRRAGFEVVVAENGPGALGIFEARSREIDCVLLDLTMPTMGGEETYRLLRRLRADVRVVLSSGFDEEDAIEHLDGAPLAGFVQKPYRAEALVAAIRGALAEPRP
jgi:CheY-like chemotaxis protein